MVNRHEYEPTTFQFINKVQNCPDLWDTKNKQKKLLEEYVVRYTGQISTDIWFYPNLHNIQGLYVSSLAMNIQQDQNTSGNSS